MDAAHREYREIGRRVLELLAGIDLERPQVDQARAARGLQAYAREQDIPVRRVQWMQDLRALRQGLRPSRLWPDFDDDDEEDEAEEAGDWLLLDDRSAFTGSDANFRHPFPEVQALAGTDQALLATGLGDSRHVAGVRWVTAGLNARGCQLVAGEVQPPSPRWRHLAIGRVRALLPLAEAAAAGLLAFAVGKNGDFAAVSRPRLRLDAQGRLHHWDGLPAVEWLRGRGMYFWRGVMMSDAAGRDPRKVTAGRIARWANAERRRVAIERIGLEQFMAGLGAQAIQQDDYGRLWKTEREIDGEPVVVVEVVNATRERDGSRRRYFLRVPPETPSARDAIAWSFGMGPDDYRPAMET